MAHGHHHDTEVVRDGAGYSMGLVLTVVTILVLVVIAIAVLWSAPWGDGDADDAAPNVPGITENGGGAGGGTGDDGSDGGTGDGGSGGGTGGQ
jgi:hypothetical protein